MEKFNFKRLENRFPKYPEAFKTFGLHVLSDESILDITPNNNWDICPEADEGCDNAKDPTFFERFCNGNYNSCSLISERTITLCTYKR